MKKTQCDRVLSYMREFGGITSLDAFRDLGITRLSGRIKDLRNRGYIILTTMIDVFDRWGEPHRVARYSLIDN